MSEYNGIATRKMPFKGGLLTSRLIRNVMGIHCSEKELDKRTRQKNSTFALKEMDGHEQQSNTPRLDT